jgi:hypothetical protein
MIQKAYVAVIALLLALFLAFMGIITARSEEGGNGEATATPHWYLGECWDGLEEANREFYDKLDPEWLAKCWYCVPDYGAKSTDDPYYIPKETLEPGDILTPTPEDYQTPTPTPTVTATPQNTMPAPQFWAETILNNRVSTYSGSGWVYTGHTGVVTTKPAYNEYVAIIGRHKLHGSLTYHDIYYYPDDANIVAFGSDTMLPEDGSWSLCFQSNQANASGACSWFGNYYGFSPSVNTRTFRQSAYQMKVACRKYNPSAAESCETIELWVVYYGIPPVEEPEPTETPLPDNYCSQEPGLRDDDPIVPPLWGGIKWRFGGCYTLLVNWDGLTIPAFLELWEEWVIPGFDGMEVCINFAELDDITIAKVTIPWIIIVVPFAMLLVSLYFKV